MEQAGANFASLQSASPLRSGLPSQPLCSLMCMWPSTREQVEEEPSGFKLISRLELGELEQRMAVPGLGSF